MIIHTTNISINIIHFFMILNIFSNISLYISLLSFLTGYRNNIKGQHLLPIDETQTVFKKTIPGTAKCVNTKRDRKQQSYLFSPVMYSEGFGFPKIVIYSQPNPRRSIHHTPHVVRILYRLLLNSHHTSTVLRC